MGRTLVLAGAIVVAAVLLVVGSWLRPTGFMECHAMIEAELYRAAGSASLDPPTVEADAARVCAGAAR